MENSELQRKWPDMKRKIQEEHPHLTDEDLHYEFGKESELFLRLQEKLKKNKDEIDNWLALMG